MDDSKQYRKVLIVGIATIFSFLAFLSSYYKYYDLAMIMRLDPIEISPDNNNILTLDSSIENSVQGNEMSGKCKSLLSNLNEGKWVVFNESLAREIDDVYKSFWSKRGIQNQWERQDGKCGYNNLQDKVKGSNWPRVGGWCDPHGNRPCSSDVMNSDCRAPNNESCTCPTCVDTRLYKVAEAARWRPDDENCAWEYLTGNKACEAIKNSIFSDIHYVGDSFMRNMFVGLMMILSNDTHGGAWTVSTTKEQKKKCHGVEFFFWDKCRTIIETITELQTYNSLCAGKPPSFNASVSVYFDIGHASHFLNLVKSRLGRPGTLVVVGVGIHMDLNPTTTINRYLSPAVEAIKDYYATTNGTRWPKLIYTIPMPVNPLKPTQYIRSQNPERHAEFSKKLKMYCTKNDIPVLDFHNMARFSQSFDGSHYGLAVNLMKNQILLNYIVSL